MDSKSRRGGARQRRFIGAGILALGIYVLFGGLFLPPHVMLREPGIVPMPERLVAIWLVTLGLAVLAWPRGRS